MRILPKRKCELSDFDEASQEAPDEKVPDVDLADVILGQSRPESLLSLGINRVFLCVRSVELTMGSETYILF